MTRSKPGAPPRFPLFASGPPGLEPVLLEEVRELGWSAAKEVPGGVEFSGSWPDVWRANLLLRGASRILIRVGRFRAPSLPVLFGEARKLSWEYFFRTEEPFAVEATCQKSKVYHSGAAAERVAKAIEATSGALSADDGLRVFVRIVNNMAEISVDSSGDLLHKRGFKQSVVKAPLRETMASLLLRACDYDGSEPLIDPLCGSGTIAIEAAEIARGLAPGRARGFAFEDFPSFHAEAYGRARTKALTPKEVNAAAVFAFDRQEAAINAVQANAERAGVGDLIHAGVQTLSELQRPETGPGLVLCNPPYGARIGDPNALKPLYEALGQVFRERFEGWRLGFVTSRPELAKATRLELQASAPVPHGGTKIRLYQAFSNAAPRV